jgi:murein DD-endopeptidase MepM/ murein hydrolase activator NlpD
MRSSLACRVLQHAYMRIQAAQKWSMLALFILSAGCADDIGDPDQTSDDVVGSLAPMTREWSWPLARDYGIRNDSAGGGAFGADRNGNAGGHSGVDFLAPVGTEVLAVCGAAQVSTGDDPNGYGLNVTLRCPLPQAISAGKTIWASMLFAHLSELAVSSGDTVVAGQRIGRVGKTGNARSSRINSHVHFEIALHGSEYAARAESHRSRDHSASAGSANAIKAIRSTCTLPLDFRTMAGPLSKGRRIDPFVLVTCLAKKAVLENPSASLQSPQVPWRQAYEARFNVDDGR